MFCLLRKSRVALSKSVISLLPHQREKSNSVRHPLFKHSQVSSNVWRLEEAYFDSWNLANMYFVRGSDADLLVDTGIGVHYLPSYLLWSKLREDKEKPLIVALTHTHFDHSGGAYQFAELPSVQAIYVHEKELNVMKTGSKYHTAAWITPDEIIPKPADFRAQDYCVKSVEPTRLKPLKEGDHIDLGDKRVDVLHLPGHSPGSIGLRWDEFLVTGDTVYGTDHELIDWYPNSSCRQMSSSVTRILKLSQEIRTALPGHNCVLNKDQLVKACEGHLRSCGKWRIFRKSMSRTRACVVLAVNARSSFFLPTKSRDWLQR